jgi:hypothetical protein
MHKLTMTKRFISLSRHKGGPYPSDFFPEAVSQSCFSLWSPHVGPARLGEYILVGVMLSCLYDLRLLDAIEVAMQRDPAYFPQVATVDWSDLRLTVLEPFGPTLTLADVYHSPIVCVWNDGNLSEMQTGSRGRDLLYRKFGIDAQAIMKSGPF